jgi:hypothetical protein
MYSADKPFQIIEDREWWDDAFDATVYGREYDFTRSFFDQFRDLMLTVPLPHLHRDFSRMQNSNYCNAATGLKNCYLCMAADEVEDTYYSFKVENLKNCVDVSFTNNSELCGNSAGLVKCYNVHFSEHCENSNDLSFCSDLSGCTACVGCINLRNKLHCIFNVQYSKEEYDQRIKEMRLDTASGLVRLREQVNTFFRTQPRRFMHGRNNVDVTGDFIYNSKNVHDSYAVIYSEDCRYVNSLSALTERNADAYDWSQFGIGSERIYECSWVGLHCNTVRFSFWNYYAHDLEYCFGCHSSDNLFGCIGLRKKRYGILNKQYTKEEYDDTVNKIKEQMMSMPYQSRDGTVYRYGEFFPPELSPFGYNETEAQDHLPLQKERGIALGYNWHDLAKRDPILDAVQPNEVPDAVSDFQNGDSKRTFVCETFVGRGDDAVNDGCSEYYKFIPQEIAWYKERALALPRKCPRCRFLARFKAQPLFQSYRRECACFNGEHGWHSAGTCSSPFLTSYAPDRPEPVYCEKCYSAIMY